MTLIPKDSVTNITDLETLKVISDPLRLNILQIVGEANKRDELCSGPIAHKKSQLLLEAGC